MQLFSLSRKVFISSFNFFIFFYEKNRKAFTFTIHTKHCTLKLINRDKRGLEIPSIASFTVHSWLGVCGTHNSKTTTMKSSDFKLFHSLTALSAMFSVFQSFLFFTFQICSWSLFYLPDAVQSCFMLYEIHSRIDFNLHSFTSYFKKYHIIVCDQESASKKMEINFTDTHHLPRHFTYLTNNKNTAKVHKQHHKNVEKNFFSFSSFLFRSECNSARDAKKCNKQKIIVLEENFIVSWLSYTRKNDTVLLCGVFPSYYNNSWYKNFFFHSHSTFLCFLVQL